MGVVSHRGLSVTSDAEPTGDCSPSPSPCISCTRKRPGLVQRSPFCSLHVPGSSRLRGALAAERAQHQHPVVPREMLPSSCPSRAGAQCHRILWGGKSRVWGKAGPFPAPAMLPPCPGPAQRVAAAGVGMVSPQCSQSSSCSPVVRSRS